MSFVGRWSARKGAACLSAVAVVGSAAMVVTASNAAFTATTNNNGNSFAAGTVVISDDDSGTALFTAPNLAPGATQTSCITVRYDGTLGGTVRLHLSTPTGTLAPHLLTTIEEGTGGTGASCTGFVRDVQSVNAETLSAAAATYTNYATGTGSWAVTGPAQTRRYRITTTLDVNAPDTAQGATTSTNVTWEARDTSDPSSNRYAAAVLADGPALYYRLGDTDTIAREEVSGANGTYMGTAFTHPTSITGDPRNTAATFNGTDNYVTLPTLSQNLSGGFTVEAWVNFGTPNTFERALELRTSSGDGLFLARSGAANHLVLRLHRGSPFQEVVAAGAVSGSWQHLVATQTAAGLTTLYVDGVVVASGTIWTAPAGPFDQAFLGAASPLYNRLAGSLDEVAIYTKALTAAQVKAHFRAGR